MGEEVFLYVIENITMWVLASKDIGLRMNYPIENYAQESGVA